MGQIEFLVHSPIEDERDVYLTGNFNDWIAEEEDFQLEQLGPKTYKIQIDTSQLSFPLEYKYVKGGWKDEELDIWGNPPIPRKVLKPVDKIVDNVVRWRSKEKICNQQFLPKTFVIEEDFEIPQLGKRRKIWALFPHDYEVSNKRYPVLYLQDAQNLANPDAPFGNWAIDQRLGVMAENGIGDIIIIAIEHGGKDRIKEYMPFDSEHFGKGEGTLYTEFLIETLKPYVDRKFRTLPDRAHTGIGGSSMGGLISGYAGLTHNDIFSKMMIFSPSLWLNADIFDNVKEFQSDAPNWIYLYGGELESQSMSSDLRRVRDILNSKRKGQNLLNTKLSLNPEGTHSEYYWGIEFPKATRWLFFND